MSNSDIEFATIISMTYASIYMFILLMTSIICAQKVRKIRKNKKKLKYKAHRKQSNDDNEIGLEIKEKTDREKKEKWYSGIKEWFNLVKEKKKVYLSLVPHLFDQATDLGVIYQFYVLWKDEERASKEIGAANPMYFFYASCFVIILHRIISTVAIYNLTRKWTDVVLQLFDLMMIKAIWVNYKLHKNDKANPQRFLEILEATFESGPQLLISCAYILKASTTDSQEITPLIIISALFSLWSITSRVSTDDRSMFSFLKEEQRKSWTDAGFKYNKCPCLNWQYLCRVIIWRFFEITSHIFISILIWINLGGLALSIIIGFEFIWCLILAIGCKVIDPLCMMMYLNTAVTNVNNHMLNLLYFGFLLYRPISNWIYLILVTIFAAAHFEAKKVEEYDVRHGVTINSALGLFMLIYCWVISCIWPWAALYGIASMGDVDVSVRSVRNLRELIGFCQFDDVLELMEFGIVMTAKDVIETDTEESCLFTISENIQEEGVTVNLLIVLQHIIDVAPKTVQKNHLLYPLELEYKNGGGLIHLAVSLTMINDKKNVRDKSTGILQEIIDNENIDINMINKNGATALHCIARSKLRDVDVNNAKILLRNGMDKNIKDKDGKTALDIIKESDYDDYINISELEQLLS